MEEADTKPRSPKARGLRPSEVDGSEEWIKKHMFAKDRDKPLYTLFDIGLWGCFDSIVVERWPSGWACGKYYPQYDKINWDVRYRRTAKDAVVEWLRRGYESAKDEFERYDSALKRVVDETEDGSGQEA